MTQPPLVEESARRTSAAPYPDHEHEKALRRWGEHVDIKLALTVVVLLRVGLQLAGNLSMQVLPPTVIGGDWLNLLIRQPRPWSDALSIWQRWDGLWYQQIALHGYHAGDGSTAFYPLYPLVSRLTSVLFLGHVMPALLLVSTAACVVGLYLLYRLVLLDVSPAAAILTVVLIALSPVGFFLLGPFTESLYLALSVAAFLAARLNRPWLAGLAGFGAGLTRGQALMLVLPLVFLYIRNRDERGQRVGAGLLSGALPAAGVIAVELYDHLVVGDTRSTTQLLRVWGYRITTPWSALGDSWHHIVQHGDAVEAVNLAALAGACVVGLLAMRRLPLAYSLYLWPYLGLLLTREMYLSPLMSVARYVLVLFPVFLALAMWLERRPWLAAVCVGVGLMLQSVLFVAQVHFAFVG